MDNGEPDKCVCLTCNNNYFLRASIVCFVILVKVMSMNRPLVILSPIRQGCALAVAAPVPLVKGPTPWEALRVLAPTTGCARPVNRISFLLAYS